MSHPALAVIKANPEFFTKDFVDYLHGNLHIYDAFEREAKRVVDRGFKHYSARTIIEVLRHYSALQQMGGSWKLNDHNTPYLARVFSLLNPVHSGLFEFRGAKATKTKQSVGSLVTA